MKYSIPTLMELSQETVPCHWKSGSKHCRYLRPHRRQSSALSEHLPNRLVEETTGKSSSSQSAKRSTVKARLDFRQRSNSKNPSVAPISTKDSGFARFLRTHSSPLHQRVTAGGRIVPMDPVDGSSPAEGRVVPTGPVDRSSPAEVQNAPHDCEIAPQFLNNEATVDVQPSGPGLGTLGVQVLQPSVEWGSEPTTPVDSPPAYARHDLPSSVEPDGQFAQSNVRHQMFQPQYIPIFTARPEMIDHLYTTLNSSTIWQMWPGHLFQTLFPMTAIHAAIPSGHRYLDAWIRFEDDRTENWRRFVDSLIEESAGNSNWMEGLYCDLLALYGPIDRIVRDMDQTIARTLETRSRDRDRRVLYINMRQIVHEAQERLRTVPTLVPAVAPNMGPNMAPNMAPSMPPSMPPHMNMRPNMVPGVSPSLLNPHLTSTGSRLYLSLHAYLHGSNDGQNRERDLFDAPDTHVNGAHVSGTQINGIEPVLFGERESYYGLPGNLRGFNDDQTRERDPEPRGLDAPDTHVNGAHVNGTQINGIEPVLFGERASDYGVPDNLRGFNDDQNRERDPEPRGFDAPDTQVIFRDRVRSDSERVLPRAKEISSRDSNQDRVERERGFNNEGHFAPSLSFDNPREENRHLMDLYEEPSTLDRPSPPSSPSSEPRLEESLAQWPQQWDPEQAEAAIERWREESLQSRNESDSDNSDDVESGKEPDGGNSPGDDVESGGIPNNEQELSGEDQDDRNHHGISDRQEIIGAETTNCGQSFNDASVLNNEVNQLSQGILPVDMPQDEPIVQLSTDNAHGEITQPGGYQHHEADTNISVAHTAEVVHTKWLWMRVVWGCIQACSCF